MVTEISVPILVTDGNFDAGYDISTEEYMQMTAEKAARDDWRMNQFTNILKNQDANTAERMRRLGGGDMELKDADFKIRLSKVETLLLDKDRKPIEEDFLIEKAREEKMFIVLLNMNPATVEWDAESEINFWTEDSARILYDASLDNKTRIRNLPARDLGIELSGEKYIMKDCKIFEEYSDERFPFFFAVLVNKLEKNEE